MKIIVDAMGGDNAPDEIVKGACIAAEEFGVEVVLVGREEAVRPHMTDCAKVSVVNANEVVEMDDDPTKVMRTKKDASMTVALRMLAEGQGDAVVSAGSTGALLTQATLIVKRIRGIRRAALAPIMPTAKNGALLIDCGANAECTPEYLQQFALMGASYAKFMLGLENPRIGLLNNGTEEHKGGTLQQSAYVLLKQAHEKGMINFIGNIEGRDVMFGGADVVVTDGFTGNIMLKTVEGVGMYFAKELKGMFTKNIFTKLAALIVKDGIKSFKKKMDYNETGGAPLLGISKPVIKVHNSSGAYSLRSAIKQAMDYVAANSIEEISKNLKTITASEGEGDE